MDDAKDIYQRIDRHVRSRDFLSPYYTPPEEGVKKVVEEVIKEEPSEEEQAEEVLAGVKRVAAEITGQNQGLYNLIYEMKRIEIETAFLLVEAVAAGITTGGAPVRVTRGAAGARDTETAYQECNFEFTIKGRVITLPAVLHSSKWRENVELSFRENIFTAHKAGCATSSTGEEIMLRKYIDDVENLYNEKNLGAFTMQLSQVSIALHQRMDREPISTVSKTPIASL